MLRNSEFGRYANLIPAGIHNLIAAQIRNLIAARIAEGIELT
jgi:hypothetical protein